tara:strand:- start:78 stop:278 length:201 start_codon:yes stop_codon:yes gene_type:complete
LKRKKIIFLKNLSIKKYRKIFYKTKQISMSKRYSGKSFKDSSVKKKSKLTLKEKRRLKREKQKKSN